MPAPWIDIQNLTVKYGSFRAIDDVSARIFDGVTLLYGPNGAGKSTFISTLEGLTSSKSGRVLINGKDPAKHPTSAMKEVAFLPERPQFLGSSLVADYLYWAITIGKGSMQELKRLLRNFNTSYLLKHRFNTLSMGEMQLVSLMAVLSLKRRAYILDEPNANLDPARRFLLSREITERKRNGTKFLITTHIMDELLATVDHTITLSHGRIAMSYDNGGDSRGAGLSTYISSTKPEELMAALSKLDPALSGEHVVVRGKSVGEILNSIPEDARMLILSIFSYPELMLNE